MGSTVRKRIVIGYAVIASVLVVAVAWSGVNFWRLRSALRDVLVENYRSVVAAESMIAALERQDSGVLLYVAGEKGIGESIVAQSQADFYSWYGRAIDNITIPGERDILSTIDQEYLKYSQGYLALREVVATEGSEAARRQYLETELPTFTRIRQLCSDLQSINQENMMRADEVAGAEAGRATVSMIAVAVIAVLFTVVFASRTLSSILDPLARLRGNVVRMTEGHLDDEIRVESGDEIGALAREFGHLLGALRRKEEETLGRFAKQQAKLEGLIKSLRDGIVVTDADFRIEILNPTAEGILNVTHDDAYGKHFLEVLDDQAVFAAIRKSLDEKLIPKVADADSSVLTFEARNKWQGREEARFYAVTASPVRTQAGVLNGVVVVFNDITKYKEVDEVKSRFVATVAHEFRTPLTSIAMSAGLLLEQEEVRDNPRIRPLLDIIRDDSGRLSRMVNELLDLSRIQAGKIEVRRAPIAAAELVQEALKPFQQQFRERSVALETDVADDCVVRADPDKIVWVISNLVGNALRYTPGGGRVTVGARPSGEQMVEIYVSDTGQGIPKEDQARLFQRFFQVRDTRMQADHGGAGLGLAISKEIVEAHEGRIWVSSQPGQGSTFSFTLRRASRLSEKPASDGEATEV